MSDDISTSSDSNDSAKVEVDIKPMLKKPKKTKKSIAPKYPIRDVCVPERCFQQTLRKLKGKRSVIDLKKVPVEKAHCNRFILSAINGGDVDNPNEQISPESTTRLMMEMRNCLQRKEYGDLSKLICMFTEMPLGMRRWYPTLIRYCLVALLYDPLVQGTGLLDLFLEGVVGCQSTEDKAFFLENINRMPQSIHVKKFNDLWNAPEDDDEKLDVVNAMNVKKLCAKLNTNTIDAHSSCTTSVDAGASDSDDWESFDENESDGDPYDGGTTTEVENTLTLGDALDKLKMDLGF